jgi:succinoglycan biosynthesis protein ExoM
METGAAVKGNRAGAAAGSAAASTAVAQHVSVCICSYKRPGSLRRLLRGINDQVTCERFTYSVVVADNDRQESARAVVVELAATAAIPMSYCVEPRQNIALARNKAVENASGDFVAFIDDDEAPPRDWLIRLLETLKVYRADGVLGPVVPRFDTPPPEWIRRGNIFDRPSLATGTWLRWKQTRTGNVLLRRDMFDDEDNRFQSHYGGGGEDVDFFRRMIAKGRRFVWCAEAGVEEFIPAERCRRTYVLTRALLRGRAPHNRTWPALVSLVAIPVYAIALPVLLVCGQHVFMRYLIRECDHLGRLLALVAGKRMKRLALRARA